MKYLISKKKDAMKQLEHINETPLGKRRKWHIKYTDPLILKKMHVYAKIYNTICILNSIHIEHYT